MKQLGGAVIQLSMTANIEGVVERINRVDSPEHGNGTVRQTRRCPLKLSLFQKVVVVAVVAT
jgi:hypothetical protein